MVFYKFMWKCGGRAGFGHDWIEGLKSPQELIHFHLDPYLLFLSLASFSDSIYWQDDWMSPFQCHVGKEGETGFLPVAPENVSPGLAWISSHAQPWTSAVARGMQVSGQDWSDHVLEAGLGGSLRFIWEKSLSKRKISVRLLKEEGTEAACPNNSPKLIHCRSLGCLKRTMVMWSISFKMYVCMYCVCLCMNLYMCMCW